MQSIYAYRIFVRSLVVLRTFHDTLPKSEWILI